MWSFRRRFFSSLFYQLICWLLFFYLRRLCFTGINLASSPITAFSLRECPNFFLYLGVNVYSQGTCLEVIHKSVGFLVQYTVKKQNASSFRFPQLREKMEWSRDQLGYVAWALISDGESPKRKQSGKIQWKHFWCCRHYPCVPIAFGNFFRQFFLVHIQACHYIVTSWI